MKVSHLRELAQALANTSHADSSKAGKEWDKLRDALLPFSDLTITEFSQLLAKVEIDHCAEKITTELDDSKINDSLVKLNELFESATESGTTFVSLSHAIQSVVGPLKRDEAIVVAKQFGIVESIRSKKDAQQKIENRITGRKEAHDHLVSVRDM